VSTRNSFQADHDATYLTIRDLDTPAIILYHLE